MKQKYINNLEEGQLIAFEKGRVQSGKVVETKEDYVLVEEFSGQILLVPKEEIIWVKTGRRWPSNIYKALRSEDSEQKENKENCRRDL